MIRVPQNSNARNRRHGFLEKLDHLASQLVVYESNSSDVATGPWDARHETALDRIVADQRHDRDRPCCLLHVRCYVAAIRKDYLGVESYQFRSQVRKPLSLAFRETVFDPDGLSVQHNRELAALRATARSDQSAAN